MSEIEQLKKRIIDSAHDGVETAHIRDDYEPIGQLTEKRKKAQRDD